MKCDTSAEAQLIQKARELNQTTSMLKFALCLSNGSIRQSSNNSSSDFFRYQDVNPEIKSCLQEINTNTLQNIKDIQEKLSHILSELYIHSKSAANKVL